MSVEHRFGEFRRAVVDVDVCAFTRQEVAAEGRQTIAHGVSRGLGGYRSQAPAGAKESEWEIGANVFSFAPLELIHPSALSHG